MNLLLPILIVAAAGAYAYAKTGTNLQENIKISFYNLGKIKFDSGIFKIYFDLLVQNYSKETMKLTEYNLKINYYANANDYGKEGKEIEIGRSYAINQAFIINTGSNKLANFNANISFDVALKYLSAAINVGTTDLQVIGYITINNLKFPVNERISFSK